MFCAISEDQQLRFLRKVTGEISAAQKAGKPFDVDQYIVDVYEEIRTKTGDAVKAYTYTAYIPKNIISIVAESSDIRKYFKGKMDGVADLADQFEDYENVRLHISGIVGVQEARPVETPPADYIESDVESTASEQPVLEQVNAAPSVEAGAAVEEQIADIERRRQEEIANIKINTSDFQIRKHRAVAPDVVITSSQAKASIKGALNGDYSKKRINQYEELIKKGQISNKQKILILTEVEKIKIDIKYDAELAALEQPVQETVSPSTETELAQSKQFTPLGRSNLTTVGFEFTKQGEKDMDPVSVGSFAFIRQYDAAREDGIQTDPQMQKVKLKVVTAKSIFDELSESDKAYEAASETSGVKVIATIDGQPIRVNSDGIISEEGVIPQWNITKPILNNGVYSRQNETPAEEIAAEFGLSLEEVVRQRQKEYSILDKLRNAILANPSKDIYLDVTSASTGFINKNYREPSALSSIDFGKLGTRFTPFVKTTGPNKGYAYFTLATSNIEFNIDRPPLSEVVDVTTLAKYMMDQNVPLEVRREIVDSIVYLKDFKITQNGVMFMGQLVTEDAIVGTITRSTAPGGTNAIRANIPKAQIESNSDMQIPYYENDIVQYRSIPVKDYLIKYFNTPYELDGRYKKGSPFLTFNVPNNEQLAITEFLETTESLPEGTSRIASTPTGVSFKIDSASILDDLANTLRADVAERGVGDVFNLPLELGERLDDNVDNRTDQNCK